MRSNIRIFLCFWLITAKFIAYAQSSVSPAINAFLAGREMTGSSVGIAIFDLAQGKNLAEYNSRTLMAPASVLKLVTSGAAIEMLGPEYRFKTLLGFRGIYKKDSPVLEGNLVVKGGGDPTLGSLWFKDRIPADSVVNKWIAGLRRMGIKRISGDLVMDVSAYEGEGVPGSWSWEDIGNYYGAGPSALSFNDNLVRLYFDSPQQAGEPVTLVRTEPALPGITWQNEVLSSAINRDMAYVFGSPWGVKRKITGTIPAGRQDFLVKASMPDPPAHFGHYFSERLAAEGIKLEGSVMVSTENIEAVMLDHFESPRLADILIPLNYESINLFADHLVFQIALEKTGKGSLETGLKLIQQFWKEQGVRDTFFMDDGSGLSRYNAITAEQMIRVLASMYKGNFSGDFLGSLPVAGKGTLNGFKTTDFPGKTLRCKSGSLDKVRNYAGYLLCDSGKEVAFAVIVNNFSCTMNEMGRKLQQLLLEIKKTY